jgi:hypothetical protein
MLSATPRETNNREGNSATWMDRPWSAADTAGGTTPGMSPPLMTPRPVACASFIEVAVHSVEALPMTPPVPGMPPPAAAAPSDPKPMVRVVGKIRCEDIVGQASATNPAGEADFAATPASIALSEDYSVLSGSSATGGRRRTNRTTAFQGNVEDPSAFATKQSRPGSSLAASAALRASAATGSTGGFGLTSLNSNRMTLVLPCSGIPLVDKNAPPAQRQTAEDYAFLDLTVIASELDQLGASLPSGAASMKLGGSTSMGRSSRRQAAFSTKKKPSPFGRATLYLNALEEGVPQELTLQLVEPKGASGQIRVTVTLHGCGQLRVLSPPVTLEQRLRALFTAELADLFTDVFIEAATTAALKALEGPTRISLHGRTIDADVAAAVGLSSNSASDTRRAGRLDRDVLMADVDPNSVGAQRHQERERYLRREKERYRAVVAPSAVKSDADDADPHQVDQDRIHLPAYVPCPGVAFTLEDLAAFLFELHALTGTPLPPRDVLYENVEETVRRFAKEQRAERAFLQRLKDPKAADAAIAADSGGACGGAGCTRRQDHCGRGAGRSGASRRGPGRRGSRRDHLGGSCTAERRQRPQHCPRPERRRRPRADRRGSRRRGAGRGGQRRGAGSRATHASNAPQARGGA